MIWHIVRFEMGSLDDGVRAELEASLRELAGIEHVAWLRVSRDIDEPGVTGLITGFRDQDELDAYRDHPDHLPVLKRMRELQVPAVRLDVATEDDVTRLP